VINDSDIFPEREDEVISVIDRLVRQACNMWYVWLWWIELIWFYCDKVCELVNLKCEIILFNHDKSRHRR
jgi:hypothetical protein